MSLPSASVIIVNYNGAQYLATCLNALRDSNYPTDRFEVIVSDNASTDDSLELLHEEFPWVRVLANDRNLGFATGNNAAIKRARGDYVVLLNNDTLPARDWLYELVDVAEKYPRAGLVTGRLQLFYDQLIVQLNAETFKLGDGRQVGVQVYSVDSATPRGVVQYLEGFWGWELDSGGRPFRWTQDRALIGVPVPRSDNGWHVDMQLAASRPGSSPVSVSIHTENGASAEWTCGSQPSKFELTLPPSARTHAHPLVQNTGAIAFRAGMTRDRGTFVRDAEVLYETDAGQYNRVEEVFSGCGASLLIRREMINHIGAFDDDFFMYYEDTDLAWRARLHGWHVMYAPQAIVRHIHCGTSIEWSPLFMYLVERNRLAMVFKNGAIRQVMTTWAQFAISLVRNLLLAGRAAIRHQPIPQYLHLRGQLRALAKLMLWLPSLLRKRSRIQKKRTVAFAEIEKWFID